MASPLCDGEVFLGWVDNSFSPCWNSIIFFGVHSLMLLVLVAPYRLYQLYWIKPASGTAAGESKMPGFTLRVVFSLLLLLIPLADMLWRYVTLDLTRYHVVSDCLQSVAWALSLLLVSLEEERRLTCSMGLRAWWILAFVCCAFKLQTVVFRADDSGVFLPVNLLFFLQIVVVFLMSCIAFLFNGPDDDLTELDAAGHSESTPLISGSSSSRAFVDASAVEEDSPEQEANVLSYIVFHWANDLMRLGRKSTLELADLLPLISLDNPAIIEKRFMKRWQDEMARPREERSLARAIRHTFGVFFMYAGFLRLISDVLQFAEPLFLNQIITFLSTDEPLHTGVLYAVALFLVSSVRVFIEEHYKHISARTGIRVNACLEICIYSKAFSVKQQQFTVGEVTNFMAVDCLLMEKIFPLLHFIWSAPIQIIVCIILIFNFVGGSAFIGFSLMILVIPLQIVLVKFQSRYQKAMLGAKDSRIKLMNEVLAGMRVIKFFSWEQSYKEAVLELREEEASALLKQTYLKQTNIATFLIVPMFVSLLTFLSFTLLGNELTPAVAFTTIALFNSLTSPLAILPRLIGMLVDAAVSIKRIQRYLSGEDRQDADSDVVHIDAEHPMVIQEASFKWAEDDEQPTLVDVSLRVPRGSLVALVGPVGSGKSSLLSAFLGDMTRVSGRVSLDSQSVAFAPQQAWIENSTVRDNILFGQVFEARRYHSVVAACELEADFAMLPAGDSTEIGERGVNLSGGQKQRISIARCVYSDKELYLLDDILSAVDVHVGRNLFDNCLRGILSDKTVLIVTHQLHFLPEVDYVYVMRGGRISQQGTYDELMSDAEGEFAQLIENFSLKGGQAQEDQEEGDQLEVKNKEEDGKKGVEQDGALVAKEKREYGSLDLSVIKAYAHSLGGVSVAVIFLVMLTLETVATTSMSFWLADWSEDIGYIQNPLSYWLGVYAAFGAVSASLTVARSLYWAKLSVDASQALHSTVLSTVLRAPMAFFDTTPTGRIINRFSSDLFLVDQFLPLLFAFALIMTWKLVATIVVISAATPMFLIFLFPLAILYRNVQATYMASSREIKRLQSIAQSPIYHHFAQTLNGITTLRSYNMEDNFKEENRAKLGNYMRAFYSFQTATRWLGVRLGMLGTAVAGITALFGVFSKGTIDAGVVGLAISYSLFVTKLLSLLMTFYTETETNLVSVERIDEYCHLQQEPAALLPLDPPANVWPTDGRVEFKDYNFRYRTGLDLVLRGLSFNVEGGWKVGICGRTGAGKSSLVQAMFRFVGESAGGSIEIDGRNICSVGTDTLRRALTIIPQDPMLFSGTLRRNLDPFDEVSDDRVWSALEKVHLREDIEAIQGLASPVTDGGDNFSVGQRQLLCLARALLRDARILILDEATSNVDAENDSLIQETIREAFRECTVLTIAHRINTIVDSDMILVLEAGQVVEYDTPENLLNDRDSQFFSLVNSSGQ